MAPYTLTVLLNLQQIKWTMIPRKNMVPQGKFLFIPRAYLQRRQLAPLSHKALADYFHPFYCNRPTKVMGKSDSMQDATYPKMSQRCAFDWPKLKI